MAVNVVNVMLATVIKDYISDCLLKVPQSYLFSHDRHMPRLHSGLQEQMCGNDESDLSEVKPAQMEVDRK